MKAYYKQFKIKLVQSDENDVEWWTLFVEGGQVGTAHYDAKSIPEAIGMMLEDLENRWIDK